MEDNINYSYYPSLLFSLYLIKLKNKNIMIIVFLQTKEAAIKALVELDDQGGKDSFSII